MYEQYNKKHKIWSQCKKYTDRSTNKVYYKLLCKFSDHCDIPGKNGYQGFIGSDGESTNFGSVGDKGDSESKGNLGLIGDEGELGSQGGIGLVGNKGQEGYNEKGKTGEIGNHGGSEQGDLGSTGYKGIGESGNIGMMGNIGNIGNTGNTGNTGSSKKGDGGSKGLNGNSGTDGTNGIIGSRGDKGKNKSGNKGQIGDEGNIGDPGTTCGTFNLFDTYLFGQNNTSDTITISVTESPDEPNYGYIVPFPDNKIHSSGIQFDGNDTFTFNKTDTSFTDMIFAALGTLDSNPQETPGLAIQCPKDIVQGLYH